MNGTDFWKQFVRSIVDEHSLVINMDQYDYGYTEECDEKTIEQLASSMQDAAMEFKDDYEHCPECEGRGWHRDSRYETNDPRRYVKCEHCDGSGYVKQENTG